MKRRHAMRTITANEFEAVSGGLLQGVAAAILANPGVVSIGAAAVAGSLVAVHNAVMKAFEHCADGGKASVKLFVFEMSCETPTAQGGGTDTGDSAASGSAPKASAPSFSVPGGDLFKINSIDDIKATSA